jgi:hypothetical protein
MNATARDFNSLPADTNGFEEIFDVSEIPENNDSHSDSQPGLNENHLILTVAEASANMRIPLSTMYRRVRAGKFKTVNAEDGTVRIILPQKIQSENHLVLTDSHSENQNGEVILSDSQSENQVKSTEQSHDLGALIGLLNDRDHKIEAASYRIGYLESQLEERDRAIKLLTDSQHQPSWWTKFKSWFMGSP